MVYSICSPSGYVMYVLYVILLSSWTQMHYGTHSCIGILWDWLVLNQWPVWTFSLSLSLRQTMANVNVEHRQANISHVPNPAIRIPRTSVSIAYARFVVQRYTHILTLSQSQCRMLKASKYFRYNLWKFDLASEWHSIRLYWWRTSTSRYRYISK